MTRHVSAFLLAPLAFVCLLTTPLQAQPASDGGLLGFTTTGILVGTPANNVQLPFAPSPSLHNNQVSLDTQALMEHRAADIYVPGGESVVATDLSTHYFQPANFSPQPQQPVLTGKEAQLFHSIDYRLRKLRALSDKVNRIVNPRIRTKNFDIQLSFQGLLHR